MTQEEIDALPWRTLIEGNDRWEHVKLPDGRVIGRATTLNTGTWAGTFQLYEDAAILEWLGQLDGLTLHCLLSLVTSEGNTT